MKNFFYLFLIFMVLSSCGDFLEATFRGKWTSLLVPIWKSYWWERVIGIGEIESTKCVGYEKFAFPALDG